jgi:hypothetical protein
MMSDSPGSPPSATEGDATRAFDALRAEVLTVHVAIAELTKSVNDIRPIDYTPSLGKIAKGLAQVIERLERIEQHPALLLTPAQHQLTLAAGARFVMREPLAGLQEERRSSERHTKELAAVVGAARRKEQQLKWVLVTAAAALGVGLFLSPFFARLLPFGLDGRVAAAIMGNDRWNAGLALLQAQSPQGLHDLEIAAQILRANRAALDDCSAAAAKTHEEQHCVIVTPQGDWAYSSAPKR